MSICFLIVSIILLYLLPHSLTIARVEFFQKRKLENILPDTFPQIIINNPSKYSNKSHISEWSKLNAKWQSKKYI